MNNNLITANPVSISDRIVSLDVLRGFAILGMLIINIQCFSMIEAAYINPTAYGDLIGINKLVWMLSHVFADLKFISIFSILFGAGIVLFTDRVELKGLSPRGLHYRRIFWLFIIGMTHAYLFWYGDILVSYSLCGLLAYLLRKTSPKILLTIGLIIFSVASAIFLFSGWSMQFWPPESIEGLLEGWKPNAGIIAEEVGVYQGSWFEQMGKRAYSAVMFQTFFFLSFFVWRAGGLIITGMALYKLGVLTAQRSNRFYAVGMAAGFLVGMPLIIYGINFNFSGGWVVEKSMFTGSQFNYWGSLFVAFGYICMIMLLCKRFSSGAIKSAFAATGRMALTNYLLQTLLCTSIFYGHGFGLFGEVERYVQILIVFSIWIVQLVISPLWLRSFRFGPAEWLWRSLTYWKIQPMQNG